MQDINMNEWYRIPGYNGYDYRFSDKAIRSWKINKKYGGKILHRNTYSTYDYELTRDDNRRVKLIVKEIEDIIINNPPYISGNGVNFATRMHLMNADNYHQRTVNEMSDVKNIVPSFDMFIV